MIQKLQALAKGTAGNSTGADVAEAVNALIDFYESVIGLSKVGTSNSVSSLIADVVAGKVVAGDVVLTLSYYAGKTQGGNVYLVIDEGSSINRPAQDGGSVIHCGAGGYYLKGLFFSGVWVEQFGAKPEANFDNSSAVANAAAFTKAGNLYAGFGRFELGSTVYTPVGVLIQGKSGNVSHAKDFSDTTCFASQAGGTYVEDFLFFQNIDPNGDTNTWVKQFPNNGSGGAQDIYIDGSASGGINGIKFAGSNHFKRMACDKVGSLVRKAGVYTDKVVVEDIHARNRANDTEYLVDLPGVGDCYELRQIASGYLENQTGVTKSILIGPVRGVEIYGSINGDHLLKRCRVAEIHGCHLEGGSIYLEDCNARVHDNAMYVEEDAHGQIICTSEQGYLGNRFDVAIDNNVFGISMNRRGGMPTTIKPDIITHQYFNVTLGKNTRNVFDSTAVVLQQYMGCIVGSDEGLLDDYNNYSHIFSQVGCQIINNKVVQTGVVPTQNRIFGGLNAGTATISGCTWRIASGTYFYKGQVLIDPVRRLGRSQVNPTDSVTVTNGGIIAYLTIEWEQMLTKSSFMLRVYRGTADGQYDSFVDIPISSTRALYDDGLSINGFVWQSRPAGDVDPINPGLDYGLTLEDGNAVCKTVGSMPTLGAWKAGDVVKKVNITPPGAGLSTRTAFHRLTDGDQHVQNTDWWAAESIQG